jgi:membrane-associated phospholipid phosphatase
VYGTTVGPPARRSAGHLARVVTETFAPAIWAAAMPVVIGLHARGWPVGLGWGLTAVIFSAAIPYGVIWFGVRRGQLTDHHIGRREQRRVPLLIGLGSVAVGLALLVVLRAPGELVAMVVVMLVVGLGVTVVNQYWKLSAHTAVSAGCVTVLTMVYGPVLLVGLVLVAAIGWSRVVLRDHTIAQVIAGAGCGALLAAVSFGLLR